MNGVTFDDLNLAARAWLGGRADFVLAIDRGGGGTQRPTASVGPARRDFDNRSPESLAGEFLLERWRRGG